MNTIKLLVSLIFLPLSSLALQLHAGAQLNENSFNETVSGLWFIENYSPFCPHCKRFAPTWVELVENMQYYKSQGLNLGQIDCIAQGDLCFTLNVDFYPQMKLFEDGKFIENYSGDKTVESIKSYLVNKLEAYKTKLKPTDIFESEPTILEPVTQESTIDEIGAESPLATEHTGSGHQDHSANQNYHFNSEDVPNRDGKLVHLNSHNWAQYTHLHHSGHPILIHYHTAWCKECRQLNPILAHVATELKNEVNVGEYDCEHKSNKHICANEALVDFPAFLLYHDGTKVSYSGEHTAEGLAHFARQISTNRGTHEISPHELDRAISTYHLFFLFLHFNHTSSYIVNAVQSVGKSFVGSALILRSNHDEVYKQLSIERDYAYLVVFKEHDPSPWAKIAIRDPDGPEGKLASDGSQKLAISMRHWIALNSVPLLDELSNANFYRVLNSGAKKLVVLACLSGMVTDQHGQLDIVKSNPKSVQLRQDMKIWAHQWRKSQEARGVDDMMIDWVWINAEQWAGWLYDAYGVNLPQPKQDPKESSAIVIIDAFHHKYYDTQENGLDIQFKASSVFQTLLGVEMNKLKGKLSGTRWGRIKWRFHQLKESMKFLFSTTWLIFWSILFAFIWFSIKSFKNSSKPSSSFDSKSYTNGLQSNTASQDLLDSSVHCKPAFGQVFGLGSNIPSFKAD